jgi:Secretion system C-terminal sorting domain
MKQPLLKDPPSVFDLKMYPNPSQDEMNIELFGEIEGKEFNISVYNTLGQNIFSTKTSNTKNWILKKKDIGKGVFIVTINTGQRSVSKKIVFD